jgi:cytochrome c-type biogenesis protein CcmE
LLLAVVVIAIAVVAMQFLGSAALYYRNADEAVRDKASLGTKRFRIQGVVENGVEKQANEVDFMIDFNGTRVAVRHVGDPPELFKPGVPVVLEGRWQGDYFASDRILIKHSAEYREQNPDRLSNAPG